MYNHTRHKILNSNVLERIRTKLRDEYNKQEWLSNSRSDFWNIKIKMHVIEKG